MSRRPRRSGGLRRAMRGLCLCCAVVAGGCALTSAPFAAPGPLEMPELERRWAADRTDVRTALRLATGHIAVGDLVSAERVLQATHDVVPTDPTVAAVLAMTEHGLEQYGEADLHYRAFLRSAAASPFAPRVRARIDVIRPHVLRAAAEARATLDPLPAFVRHGHGRMAVAPFEPDASDPDGLALGVALGDLLSRDLDRASQPVVDADQVRVLLGLLPEPRTLAVSLRLGALLEADHVVHGRIAPAAPGRAALEATVLSAASEGARVTGLRVEGDADDLIRLQKRLAVQVLESVGGQVEVRQAAAVAEPEVVELDAVIAFGRGLLEIDAGRYVEAEAEYGAATRLDPGFAWAGELQTRARSALSIGEVPLTEAAVDAGRFGERDRAIAMLRTRPGSFGAATASRLGAHDRVAVTELLGGDLLTDRLLFQLELSLPGGGGGP